MTKRTYIIIAIFAGIITGLITTYSFFAHSWTSIILWAVIGLGLFSFSPDRRATIYAGALYGFVDMAAWLSSGFQGSSSARPQFVLVIIIAGIIGGAVAAAGAVLFNWVFKKK